MGDSFRDLLVWQRAVQMSVAIYCLTDRFPKQEIFGLTGQLRRAGVSVASNIAEGYGRMSSGEYKQFLGMARGSVLEVQTQLVDRPGVEVWGVRFTQSSRRTFGRGGQDACRHFEEALSRLLSDP